MPRQQASLEAHLAEMRRLQASPHTAELEAALHSALVNGVSPVVARAANIVAERKLAGLLPSLCVALKRFANASVRQDPSCAARLALVTALDVLNHADVEIYEQAARTVQLEPSWGPPVDTAPPLRARAALALGRFPQDSVLPFLGELLADPAPVVRHAAIDALACRADPAATALLLMRFQLGDSDPVAHGACVAALIGMAPEHMLPRVSRMLRNPAEDHAMLGYALAESRSLDALSVLTEWLDDVILSTQRVAIIDMIAAHRTDAAEEVLVALVEEGSKMDAQQAITGLAARASTPTSRGDLLELAAQQGLLDHARQALASVTS